VESISSSATRAKELVVNLTIYISQIPVSGQLPNCLQCTLNVPGRTALLRPCAKISHRLPPPMGRRSYILARTWSVQTPIGAKRETFIGAIQLPLNFALAYTIFPNARLFVTASKLILRETVTTLDGPLMFQVTLLGPSIIRIVLTRFVAGRNGLRGFFTGCS